MKIIRFFILIIHLGISVLLFGTLLNAYIPPKVFPWVNLLSLGFPVLVILYFGFIVFWIVCWKKRAFIFLFLSLFLINPIQRWVNFSSEVKENPNFKIISLNIKGGRFGKDAIKDFLNKENADLILLQEDNNTNFDLKNLKRTKITPILSMYTQYEVLRNEILVEGNSVNENAFIVQNDIDFNGKTIRVINCYLQPFKFQKKLVKINGDHQQDEKTLKYVVKKLLPIFKVHQKQIDLLKDKIKSSPYPVIVAGDFNSVPNSYEYYQIADVLQDSFLKIGRGSGTSFHDYKFPIRIDYIFASESLQPVNFKVDRSKKLSDHFPIIGNFKIE